MKRLGLILAAALLAVGVGAAPAAARTSSATIVGTAIAANQQSGEFDYLIAAVQRAGLVNTLNGNRQFTVFAPTDAAFQRLFGTLGVSGVDAIPIATLRTVLLHHVAPGARDSDEVLDSTRIRTLNRDFVHPRVAGGAAYIDGARILTADIRASNGVIHVIDSVLLP
jgi:uncharacterized surface protein with fasciclin (FAS1) repeats